MPAPLPSDLHVDGLLTDMSVAYVQSPNAFVADAVFPRKPVQKQSDKYATFPKAAFFRDDMQRRANATATAGVQYETSSDSYLCEDWGLHIDVDDRQIANADSPFSPVADATLLLTQKELIKREVEWVNAFFTTGVWGTDLTGGSDFTQIADAGSDPIGLLADQQEAVEDATGFLPMDLVVNRKGWNALRNHPDIVARITGGATSASPAVLTMANVAAVLGVERIHVAAGVKNTAAEGVTASMSRIAGNHALLVYVDPNPGLMTPTAGVTFVWNGYIGSAEGRRIKRWRIEEIESERVEIQANWDQKVVGSDLGVFLSGFVS
jgi:hypothetical protein